MLARDKPLHLRMNGQDFSLTGLQIKLKVWRQVERGKVFLTRIESAISGNAASYVGVAKTHFNSKELAIFFTIETLKRDRATQCRVQLSDSSGNPFFPVGTPVEVRLFATDTSWGPGYWSTDAVGADGQERVSVVLDLPHFS